MGKRIQVIVHSFDHVSILGRMPMRAMMRLSYLAEGLI